MQETFIIPLAEELADANYIDWMTIQVNDATDRVKVEHVIQSVKLSDHDPDENNDYDTEGYQIAVEQALRDWGYTPSRISVGKLTWPGGI